MARALDIYEHATTFPINFKKYSTSTVRYGKYSVTARTLASPVVKNPYLSPPRGTSSHVVICFQ